MKAQLKNNLVPLVEVVTQPFPWTTAGSKDLEIARLCVLLLLELGTHLHAGHTMLRVFELVETIAATCAKITSSENDNGLHKDTLAILIANQSSIKMIERTVPEDALEYVFLNTITTVTTRQLEEKVNKWLLGSVNTMHLSQASQKPMAETNRTAFVAHNGATCLYDLQIPDIGEYYY